jgi:hypothetical protein
MVRLAVVAALLAAWALASPDATAQVTALVLLAAVAAAGLCLAALAGPAAGDLPALRARGLRPAPVLVRVHDPATPGRPRPRAPGGVLPPARG